jgi:hypothetical protein
MAFYFLLLLTPLIMLVKPRPKPAANIKQIRKLHDQFNKLSHERYHLTGIAKIRVIEQDEPTQTYYLGNKADGFEIVNSIDGASHNFDYHNYTYGYAYLSNNYNKLFRKDQKVYLTFVVDNKKKLETLTAKIRVIRNKMRAEYAKHN